ncbi:MAG: hypothetical protein RQ745_09980, partial [Longimicrobiales bacterium]|nr:hypothetical protein [Longimicrobiales bacterium]
MLKTYGGARRSLVRRILRGPIGTAWMVALLLSSAHARLAGQGVAETVGGAAAGAVAGSLVTAAAVTVASLHESYLWDTTHEFLGWPAIPVAVGLVGGAVQGATDSGSLGRASLFALGFATVGAGAGALAVSGLAITLLFD